jgi:hypothetical protein
MTEIDQLKARVAELEAELANEKKMGELVRYRLKEAGIDEPNEVEGARRLVWRHDRYLNALKAEAVTQAEVRDSDTVLVCGLYFQITRDEYGTRTAEEMQPGDIAALRIEGALLRQEMQARVRKMERLP